MINIVNIVPEMVTIKEATRRTGLSYSLLRNLCLQNKIIYIRTGNKYLINFEKLCDYLNKGEGDAIQKNKEYDHEQERTHQ